MQQTSSTIVAGHRAASAERLPLPSEQFSWTSAEKIVAHRNMHLMFPSDRVPASSTPRVLERGARMGEISYVYDGGQHDLESYFSRTQATALLVAVDGRIVLEEYRHGNNERTLGASRSVAKSFTSTLMGIAIREGHITSLDDKVAAYVPELQDTLSALCARICK